MNANQREQNVKGSLPPTPTNLLVDPELTRLVTLVITLTGLVTQQT